MTLQQLKFAVEIEKTRSITAAAKSLYIGQPNVSKSIKELERELGVILFRRTVHGIEPTAAGVQFLRHAKGILRQMQQLESLYQPAGEGVHFALFAPRSAYIAGAFAQLLAELSGKGALQVQFRETNANTALQAVSGGEADMAIVRYQDIYAEHFAELFAQNRLVCQPVRRFAMQLLMDAGHPLASHPAVGFAMLAGYPCLAHGDVQLPVVDSPAGQVPQGGRIEVYDRGSQYDLLQRVPGCYMWSEPLSPAELNRRSLVQKPCLQAGVNVDMALWRSQDGPGPYGERMLQLLAEDAGAPSQPEG